MTTPIEGPQPGAFPIIPQENGVVRPDYLKGRFDKQLDGWLEVSTQAWTDRATALALENDRDDAMIAAETASLAAIQTAYVTTAQGSLDRALTRANVLTASVSTVITLYTGLLAFIYTKADTGTGGDTGVTKHALELVALVPAVFLGMALLLVTIYAAVLRNKTTVGPFLPTGIGGQVAEMRLVTYMRWCFDGVLARRWALHAGITSLGFGIATLPLPFVDVGAVFESAVFAIGIGAVAFTGLWTQWGSN